MTTISKLSCLDSVVKRLWDCARQRGCNGCPYTSTCRELYDDLPLLIDQPTIKAYFRAFERLVRKVDRERKVAICI